MGNKVARFKPMSVECNDDGSDVSERCLNEVMEVLADPNTHLIGVYGPCNRIKETLKVVRLRVDRDKLFDKILTAPISKKPDVIKIQKEIAQELGLIFKHKSKKNRAQELIQRIKNEPKILIVLHDLHKGFDLGKVGIPHGSDHTGCKILLTSITGDVLSKHMHTQRNIKAR